MSIVIEYTSKADALQKLDATEDEVNKILDQNMASWFEEIVVPEVKRIAIAMNMPNGFIDGIGFRKKGENYGGIINTWGSERKPLAKWFNWGTVDHWIEPIFAKVLSWISKGAGAGKNPSAINFKSSSDKAGERRFSMGHYVSGLQRKEAMEFGITQGNKRLISELPKLIQGKLNEPKR